VDTLPNAPSSTIAGLVREEIGNIVAGAAATGGTLRIGAHARRLTESYGGAGLSQRQIADELILAASKANLAVEIDG
jgi:hypothetical protein